MWEISKEIGFDYGHRVHNQTLNKEYSVDDDCVCKHLHGHRGTLQVFLSGDELVKGMVTDFKHLNWFQKFIDDNIDHKFIIDRNDPWFDNIINGKIDTVQEVVEVSPGRMAGQSVEVLKINNDRMLKLIPVYVPDTETLTGYALDVTELSGPEKEFYEGFFIVNFVPTSAFLLSCIVNSKFLH